MKDMFAKALIALFKEKPLYVLLILAIALVADFIPDQELDWNWEDITEQALEAAEECECDADVNAVLDDIVDAHEDVVDIEEEVEPVPEVPEELVTEEAESPGLTPPLVEGEGVETGGVP